MPDENLLQQTLRRHRAMRTSAGLPEDPPLDGIFPDTGLAFFRTGWGPADQWLAFDASTDFGGGHTHLSRLAVEFHAHGRTLLPDPGIFTYEMSDWRGPASRRTAMHTTCSVDLLNQQNGGAQFLRAGADANVGFAHGRYSGGYWPGRYAWGFREGHGPGVYGSHDRILLWFKNRFLLVLDSLVTDPGHVCYSHWQLDAGPCRPWADRLAVETQGAEANALVRLLPLYPEANRVGLTVYEGDEHAQLGFIGRAGSVIPAPLLSWRLDVCEMETAALIVPFTSRAPSFEWDCQPIAGTNKRALTVRWANGSQDSICWKHRLSSRLGRFQYGGGEFHSNALLIARSQTPGGAPRTFEVLQ
jgi:hypothetical protein